MQEQPRARLATKEVNTLLKGYSRAGRDFDGQFFEKDESFIFGFLSGIWICVFFVWNDVGGSPMLTYPHRSIRTVNSLLSWTVRALNSCSVAAISLQIWGQSVGMFPHAANSATESIRKDALVAFSATAPAVVVLAMDVINDISRFAVLFSDGLGGCILQSLDSDLTELWIAE